MRRSGSAPGPGSSGGSGRRGSWFQGSFRCDFLGVEPRLWVALVVSLALHTAALFLVAGSRGPRPLRCITIALHDGAGDGRAPGYGDGRSTAGGASHGEAAGARRGDDPAERGVSSPTASGERQSENPSTPPPPQPRRRDAQPERGSARRPTKAAFPKDSASARVPERMGERSEANEALGATPARSPAGGEPPAAGDGAVAGRGEVGLGGSAGEGAAGGIGRGGGGGLQARCVACPVPQYPRQARRRGWEGVVDLRLRLDAFGRVSAVEVARSSGFELLDGAAVAAARRSRFHLNARDGTAEPAWGRMRYRFELGGG